VKNLPILTIFDVQHPEKLTKYL